MSISPDSYTDFEIFGFFTDFALFSIFVCDKIFNRKFSQKKRISEKFWSKNKP